MISTLIELLGETRPFRERLKISTRQRLYWSLCREVWEHPALRIVPVLFGIIVLVPFFVSLRELPETVAALVGPDPAVIELQLQRPFFFAALAILASVFLVSMFYCLEALQGERRDRSILFWKSMPVSDKTAVLSKAMIPLVVMPLVACAISVILQTIMLGASCAFLLAQGGDVRAFISHLRFVDLSLTTLYAAMVMTLWYAPIYGWLLFLSGWASRAVLIWALGPFLALWVTTALAGSEFSTVFESRMNDLLTRWLDDAFTWSRNVGETSVVEPAVGNVLRMPQLWLGFVFAAFCIAGAMYMRRHRESN